MSSVRRVIHGLLRPCAIAWLMLAGDAFAQCTLENTINECIDDVIADPAVLERPAAAAAITEQQRALARTNTGTIDGSSGPISTSLVDFASAFRLGVDTIDLGNDADRGLTFDWNSFVRDILTATFFVEDDVWKWAKQDHKLSVTMNNAELFSPLAESLSAAQRQTLEERINDTDDLTFSLSFSPVSQKYGRRINSHAIAVSTLFNAAWDKVGADRIGQQGVAFRNLAARAFRRLEDDSQASILAEHNDEMFDVPLQKIHDACPDSACQSDLLDAMRLMPGVAEVSNEIKSNLQAELDGFGFSMLQKLISNQPQWIAAVKHRERDVLTGRDETSVKVSYELGSYNMDDLYGYKENCGSSAACINEFISRYYDKIEAGNRLSFSAEYVRKDAYRFMMDGFEAFNLAKESSLIASAAYGRTFDSSNFLGGAEFFSERPARLDITLAYEDVDSDPMRNNRFVSSATVTQELAQGGFITLGMAYANKPEYLGEVDQELSARLGINFKLGSVE